MYIRPDDSLLQDCVAEVGELRVNGDLVRAYNAKGEALDQCNVDKAALRAFYAGADAAQR